MRVPVDERPYFAGPEWPTCRRGESFRRAGVKPLIGLYSAERIRENPIAAFTIPGGFYAQIGRPDLTFRLWRRPCMMFSPPDCALAGKKFREATSRILRQISGAPRYQLPPPPSPRGPSAEDIEAAQG